MRSIAIRLVLLAVILSSLILLWNEHNGRSVAAAQQRTPVTLTRIYSGSDGQTHAQQVDFKLMPNSLFAGREQSETLRSPTPTLCVILPGI